MEYRKLISFGNSSFVVSLPKDWLKKQGLKKGDTVYLDVNSSDIVLHPQEGTSSKETIESTINIDQLDTELMKRKVDAAYVNNADVIKIVGNDLPKKTKDVKDIIQRLVAMEVVEQNKKSLVVKSFLDVEDVDMNSILRKADRIVRGMLEDLHQVSIKPVFEAVEISDNITQRDDDVNRMTFLIFRALNRNVQQGRSKRGVTAQDMLTLWGFTFFLEEIGDLIKRIARTLASYEEKSELTEYREILEKIEDNYLKALQAFHEDDKEAKYDVATNRMKLLEKCEDILEENRTSFMAELMSRTKDLIDKIYDLNRISIMSGTVPTEEN